MLGGLVVGVLPSLLCLSVYEAGYPLGRCGYDFLMYFTRPWINVFIPCLSTSLPTYLPPLPLSSWPIEHMLIVSSPVGRPPHFLPFCPRPRPRSTQLCSPVPASRSARSSSGVGRASYSSSRSSRPPTLIRAGSARAAESCGIEVPGSALADPDSVLDAPQPGCLKGADEVARAVAIEVGDAGEAGAGVIERCFD